MGDMSTQYPDGGQRADRSWQYRDRDGGQKSDPNRQYRSRSPRDRRECGDHPTVIIIEESVARGLERDEEFFERLRDIFPMVQVEQKGTKFTFFGPEEKKADCMRYIQRHLDHNMGLNGVR